MLAGVALSWGRTAAAQAPDQAYWLPADSAIDAADGFLVPPDSEVGLPILWPPGGGYMPMGGGGGVTVEIAYPRGPGGEYPGLCPLKKPPDNAGICVRALGSPYAPENSHYDWDFDNDQHGANALYTSTACGMTYTATVTYTVGEAESGPAESGYIRVFDADLTLAGGSSDPQDTVEDDAGFFMAVGTRKSLAISLSPADPDDVMPDAGEYKFQEGLQPRGLLPPYQVTLSASGGSCVDFYEAQEGGTPLTSDGLMWGWKELDPQGHPDEFTEVSAPAQRYVQAKAPGTCTVDLWLMFRCPQECGDWPAENGSAGDTVKITVLDLKLKEVTFSADPDSPVNYYSVGQDTNTVTYPTPHWLDANGDGDVLDENDHQSPVCYKRNTKMAASVKVGVSPAQYFTGTVKIRGDGPGNLNFPEAEATVANGEATVSNVKCANAFPDCVTCYVLPDTSLAIAWEISRDGGASWIEIPTQSKNDAFIILDEPQAPQAVPWKSVLEKATYWADADTTVATAAADVAEAINACTVFKYDGPPTRATGQGASRYVGGDDLFDLTKCIADLGGSATCYVNCKDCAHMVTTFSNAIGCQLWSSQMGNSFLCNEVIVIGANTWAEPFYGSGFNYHEVAWTGSCGDSDQVFDACLKVDGNGDPSIPDRTPKLPTDMTFSDGSQGSPYVYRESLAEPGSYGYDCCLAQSGTKIRRTVK